MSNKKSLAEAARDILTGKSLKEDFTTANGARVVDHGPAIVHPLQGRVEDQDAGIGQDSTIPGSTKPGEPEAYQNPGSKSYKDVDGQKLGKGSLDGEGSELDGTIPGSHGYQEPMGQQTPGSKSYKQVDAQKLGTGTLDGKSSKGGPEGGKGLGEPEGMTNKGAKKPSEVQEEKEDKKEREEKEDKEDKLDADGDFDGDKSKEEADKKKAKREADSKKAMDEHLEALTSGMTLTEESKTKIRTVFEAALNERLSTLKEEVEAQYAERLEEATKLIQEDLSNKLDDYLSYMAQEWIKENAVAIDSGIKAAIVEDFVEGIKELCVEHNIEFPDAKVDVVESLTDNVEDLEKKLNEQIEKNVALVKETTKLRREKVISEACAGLVETQASKLRKLAEGVDANSDEEFAQKIKTLRESYISGRSTKNTENLVEDKANKENTVVTEEVASDVAAVLSVLGKGSSFKR